MTKLGCHKQTTYKTITDIGYKDMATNKVIKEVLSLLYWTMLAACTVGPGTVVTCARAGAEFELNLIWALIFASLLAYTLQEGTARLTITSGKSLGECLQVRYRHGRHLWGVAIICWVIAGAVFVGNTLYECNNFAGGMSAIYSLPGAKNTPALRISCCVGYGVIVVALLFADKVNSLGVSLGIIMVGMVVLFLVVVAKLGVDAERFFKGLIPISMPSGSSNIVLSLIGTTSLGFNLFLGGAMAKGKTLVEAQRGIAFSTSMALIVSVLIMIVGQGTYIQSKGVFTIASLAGLIQQITGKVGLWVFGIGFIAAALSSMLAVPLGAVITADNLFTIYNDSNIEKEEKPVQKNDAELENSNAIDETELKIEKEEMLVLEDTCAVIRPFSKKYYNGLMFVMVLISVVVISADAPTVKVILVAQVFNGCLLPFFSICLLICLNDPHFMNSSPQRGWANCLLMFVVTVSLFLTCNTIIQNVFGWTITDSSKSLFAYVKFSIAGVISICTITVLCLFTSLGKQIRTSFKKR